MITKLLETKTEAKADSAFSPGIYRRVSDRVHLITGGALKKLPSEVYALFERHYQNPHFLLAPEEADLLQKHKALNLFERYRASSSLIQMWNRLRAIGYRSGPRKLKPITIKNIYDSLRGLIPIPTIATRYRVHDIYKKTLDNPDYELTGIETQRLERLGLVRDFESFREQIRDYLQKGQALNIRDVRELFRQDISHRLGKAGSVVGRALSYLRGFIIPFPRILMKYRAHAIYERVIEDPNYIPSREERVILRSLKLFNDKGLLEHFNLEEDLERFRADLKIHGEIFARLNQLRRLRDYTGLALGALAIGLANSVTENITEEQNWDEDHPSGMSRYDNEVELIFTTPNPHVSLRIGGIIYNYGLATVQRLHLDNYQDEVGFGPVLSGSRIRVRLNLTNEEKKNLRSILEEEVGRLYILAYPYNTCVSQTNNTLYKATGIRVPPIADRSQAGTIGYYNSLRLMGSDRVSRIIFSSRNGDTFTYRTANAAVNVMDVSYFLTHAQRMLVVDPLWDRKVGTFEIPSRE